MRSHVRRLAKRISPPQTYEWLKTKGLGTARRAKRRAVKGLVLLRRTLVLKYRYPSLLSIFLTTRCNLRCFVCRREGFKGQDLEFDNLYKLQRPIRYARTIDLTGWGEPLLYPRFEEVLKFIYSLNPSKNLISITTNGTKLSAQVAKLLNGHLNRVIISLNAATAETYNRDMRYGDFDRTLAAVKDFMFGLDVPERRKVGLHFVAHTENFREIPEFVSLARDLGISSVSIGQYLVHVPEHRRYSLLYIKEAYNEVIEQARELGAELGVTVAARQFFVEQEVSPQECQSPFNECFIEVDGSVGPCCFCGSYRIGNVCQTDFESVWFGKSYRRLRKKRYLPACQNCMPFIPFDDYGAHFTAYLKEEDRFEGCEENVKSE